MRCKFSFRQLSGFGRIAYPRPGKATTQALPGCKSHCCSARGGSDQSGEQICGSEQKRMLQSLEMVPVLKSLYGYRGKADPLRHWGRPTFYWEATDTCTRGTHRDMEPDTQRKFSGDKVGKIHRPAGADSNLRRPDKLGTTEVDRRAMVRRMSPYEQRRTGNAVLDGDKSSPRQWLAEAKGLSAHGGQPPSHLRDCEPSPGRGENGCRVGSITRGEIGACVSALNPVTGIVEGQPRTYPDGLCIMVANRTREIRPSGMKAGACGIVSYGRRIEAQQETCWISHRTLKRHAPHFYPNILGTSGSVGVPLGNWGPYRAARHEAGGHASQEQPVQRSNAGAEGYATLLTLAYSAQVNGLKPVTYLCDSIEDIHYQRRLLSELTPMAYARRSGQKCERPS